MRVRAVNTNFSKDFKDAFLKNRLLSSNQKADQYKSTNVRRIQRLPLDADDLITYLSDNDVVLYCPYPLEDYPADNRTPAITYAPIDNDTENEGFMINQLTNEVIDVIVDEEFTEEYPAWIISPNEPKTLDQEISGIDTNTSSEHGYEVMINHIYCKEFYDGLFSTNQQIRLTRVPSSSLTYDASKGVYTGNVSARVPVNLPRKYVRYAKKNYYRGWYSVNKIWDTNWSEDKKVNLMFIYEWDEKGTKEVTIPLNTYDETGKITGSFGTIKHTFTSTDDYIYIGEWHRALFMDIMKNGNSYWTWTHTDGAKHQKIDGKQIIMDNDNIYYTMSVRVY